MSSVTHELRTPLTSIRAFSGDLLDSPDMVPAVRFLAIIVYERERLTRLVNQVLDMAKIESGNAEWHTTEIDVREDPGLGRGDGQLFRDSGVELSVSLQPAPRVRADRDRLVQVIMNLLSNAVKFPPARRPGGGPDGPAPEEGVRVDVRTTARASALPTTRSRLREVPPGQRYAHRKPGGTGLGLPISRKIVEHFGGRLWLEIEPGRARVLAFRGCRRTRHARRRGKELWAMSREVLIADDEPNIVMSLEYLVKREGYDGRRRPRRGAGAGDDPRREAAPGAARRDDAEDDRLRGLRGGARHEVRETRILMLTAKGRERDVARGLGASAPTPT